MANDVARAHAAAESLYLETRTTPIGDILLVTDGTGAVRALDWADHETRMQRLLTRHTQPYGYVLAPAPAPTTALAALDAYLGGDLTAFDALQVTTRGTPFQERVWRALRDVPPGATVTYGQLAARIGSPTASRAVGAANGANPVSLIVPCHRAIGAGGSLTGYAGGLDRKRWLLAHESADSNRPTP
jgi:methylated-DNA-[protein]-cysteine S-methyltransferase